MEKSKRPKNSAQRACLELRRLADWIYWRLLWSVQTTKGTPEPSNQWRHSSNASLTLRSAGESRWEKNAQGCTLSSEVARWDSTAPTPTSDASTSTTNWRVGSGARRMGAETMRLLSLVNAASPLSENQKYISPWPPFPGQKASIICL